MTTRNTTILHLRATGLKIREIAAEVGTTTHTVERVVYGNNTPYTPRPTKPKTTVRRKCLRCRKPFDAHPVIYRCDACKDATRDVFEGAAAGVLIGGLRGGAE
jgi:hypothetical protein